MEILDLATAKQLIGKRIRCTYSGYANQGGTKEFILKEIVSQWDLAAQDTSMSNYPNRQEYWKSYFSEEKIQEKKATFDLITSENKNTYIFADTSFTNEDYIDENGNEKSISVPFHCGDIDRWVSFEIVE